MNQIFKDDLAVHAARSFFWDLVANEIARDFLGKEITSLLDYGCSYGGFANLLQEKFSVSQVWGTDIDADCLNFCATKFSGTNFFFRPLNELSSAIPDASIDIVCAIEVLAYVHDLDWLFDLLYRKTKPRGVVYILLGMHTENRIIDRFDAYLDKSGNRFVARSVDAYIDNAINRGFIAYAKRLDLSNIFGVRLSGQNSDFGITYKEFIDYIYQDKLLIKLTK